MSFAKRVFQVAGWYGLIVLTPQYFLEKQIGVEMPPEITHPEFFYGFLGCAVAWQIAFLVIAREPLRFRPLMLAAVVEKWTFGGATIWLYAAGRLAASTLVFGLIDFALGVLFLIAWMRLGDEPI
jgi:hypothetical protein